MGSPYSGAEGKLEKGSNRGSRAVIVALRAEAINMARLVSELHNIDSGKV